VATGAAEVTRRRSAPIERASAADLALLAMETGGAVPEHLGAVFVLDAGRDFDVGSAQGVLADRIRAVPRLRQRLVRPPLGCGRPVWVDDPGFDPARHVRVRRCPAPGDEQALLDVAAEVISEPLPRSHPLWAAVFVPDLVGGQVGLVLVLHHVLADGADGLAILGRLVDGAEPVPTRIFPQPAPTRRQLATEALRSRLRSLDGFRSGGRGLRASVAGGPIPRAENCSLLHVTGVRRRFAVARADLAALHAAGRRHGGTVNDVLLTAVGGALHTLLNGRGEHVETFRIAVMVAGGKEASADVPGNQAVPLLVDVPGTGTPAERLARMSGAVRAARASTAGRSPTAIPPTLLRFLAAVGLYRLYLRHQHRLHTLVSNVRGPGRPLTLGGAPVGAIVPIAIAEAGNLTVNVIALSYAGTFTVTVSADPDQVPDLPVLAAALQAELDALTTAQPERP
jgi:diacylglycerol O-acyltransferase / wax synthase